MAESTLALAQTFQLTPFDLMIHYDSKAEGVFSLQQRFAGWLRSLNNPARFVCWQVPADLGEKIGQIGQATAHADAHRQPWLTAYRRSYEALQHHAHYQRTVCGMAVWSDENPAALAGSLASALDTPVTSAEWYPLLTGEYRLKEKPLWHLTPVGRPGGRPLWAVLTAYEFMPTSWSFFQPLRELMKKNLPLAICVDIPRTYDRNTATDKIESIILAYQTHLATATGEDSRAVRRIQDCRRTLEQLNDGDALHEVQIALAVSAYDVATLQTRVQTVIQEMRSYLRLRPEIGELLPRAVRLFTTIPTKDIHLPDSTWPLTSQEAALTFAPLGFRKLAHTDGILRGEAMGGAYPVFYQSWRKEKHASHELWVGMTGFGKTFALNCHLAREYAELGTPFDLLEPMGHGKLLSEAFGLDWYPLSQHTRLNPQDVMYPTLLEQTSHTIRIYETVLGRPLSGGQKANLERGLLANALELAYAGFGDLTSITPEVAPTCETICNILNGLGTQAYIKEIARNLADEIAALCTGSGPWAKFLNGHTTVEFGRGNRTHIPPRIFSFDKLEADPVMVALAYTQVLSAIRRDSLRDEQPRIIAVDEVYRLMRHPSLLDFLIEAVKTFRTKRKKMILIDQNMSVFLDGKARLVFENCPVRVIFNQRAGMNVFREDPAFQHMNESHLAVIANLNRYQFLFDVQDEGTWFLSSQALDVERARFGTS